MSQVVREKACDVQLRQPNPLAPLRLRLHHLQDRRAADITQERFLAQRLLRHEEPGLMPGEPPALLGRQLAQLIGGVLPRQPAEEAYRCADSAPRPLAPRC